MELDIKWLTCCAGLTVIPLFLKYYLTKTYKCLENLKTTNNYKYVTIFMKYTNHTCKQHIYIKQPCGETCSYAYLLRIKKLLNRAKYSISMCMCLLTSTEIQECLMNAQKRGLKVRLISDYEMLQSKAARAKDIIATGVQIKTQNCFSNGLLHHKFFLIDEYEPTNTILFTGSLNLTCQGLTCNWENIIITNDLKVTQDFREEFERLWSTFITYDPSN